MCVYGCEDAVIKNLSRRAFVGAVAAGAAATSGCGAVPHRPEERENDRPPDPDAFPEFRRVVDLTHTYSSSFPHYDGGPSLVALESEASTAGGDGWNVRRWTLDEHAGTHIDAPFHRIHDGITAEKIPAADLVLRLAVIDIRHKAATNADARLDLADVEAWEAAHGSLPSRCCVALLSGWDAKIDSPEFIGLDSDGVRHFPGFHADAIEYFLSERDVVALAVDTASLDFGATADFPVHTRWLGAGRWGLENAARLADVPPRGATICCGAPKIAGATGGPSRVFALV